MAKEKLVADHLDGQKTSRFRRWAVNILGTLSQSNEEKKEKINEKNENLMNSFRNGLGRYYYEEGYIHDKFDIKNGREYIRMGDTVKFRTLKELKSFLDDSYDFSSIGRGYVTLKIEHSNDWNLDDLKFILEHLNIGTYPVKIKFPSLFFNHEKGIKILEKFILRQGSQDCYFDIGDRIHRGEYGDKTDYLKELINRFTKKGKSGKISNCVIKANGKEYHSSGNYEYDFI